MFNTTMKVITTHEDYKNKIYRVICEDKYGVVYSFSSSVVDRGMSKPDD